MPESAARSRRNAEQSVGCEPKSFGLVVSTSLDCESKVGRSIWPSQRRAPHYVSSVYNTEKERGAGPRKAPGS
jgi:hypothetical protein